VTQTGQPGASYSPVESGSATRSLVGHAKALSSAISAAAVVPGVRRDAARQAYWLLRVEVTQKHLDELPLDRIKDMTQGRLRLTAIEQAGYRTVGGVLRLGNYGLQSLHGVGPQTAVQVVAAARALQSSLEEQTRVRIDPDARTAAQTVLLAGLYDYERAKANVPPQAPDYSQLQIDLDALAEAARPAGSRLRMFFTGPARKQDARDAASRLAELLRADLAQDAQQRFQDDRTVIDDLRVPGAQSKKVVDWLWNDYLQRPVNYNGLLIEVADLAPDEESVQGFLPQEIANQIRAYPLDLSLVTASLRGYQAFGAKFALVQERVIIGDEMGLGKTVQALAAMAHLAAGGATHFLVVCPASVVVNWTREIAKHTKLTAYRLHGLECERNRQLWKARGGIAVTTYEVLRNERLMPRDVSVAMLTVDEAHYAKNPQALRTKAIRAWAGVTSRVVFLTGTPMENQVEEFRVLVDHLRPQIARSVSAYDGALGSVRFRRAIAPVYLRRNQNDVLNELPPRLETEEWVSLTGKDGVAYRDAVYAGNFMAMRRAAFAPGNPEDSAKLRRLLDITDEATQDGRKVVVFSFFRDVLSTVASALGAMAVGPITGDVPPPKRQALIDEFTARQSPSVLVAQVQAGGVGLNIQAASVVIITEPQWNPAIEEQAIARAHRMGQVRRVDVHRLLAEDSVDQRILEILGRKRAEFDEYARRSDLKEVTPDSVDISDLAATKDVAAQVESERRIIDLERKRLRFEEEDKSAH
jgi:superfamily II DNA or RNA helicase